MDSLQEISDRADERNRKKLFSKTKKFTVIQNTELKAVAKGFVPVFGSAQDLSIADRLFKLHKLLGTVDNEVLRSGKNLTKKMQDILFMEEMLIKEITSRNNDF